MKVLLQQDVKNLGKKGDVVKVAEGHGRNFLIPRGLAVEATDSNIRQVEAEKQVEKNKHLRELRDAQGLGSKIEGKQILIKARVGDSGKLFGSITAQEIVDRIKSDFKVEIDKRKIELKEPIKALGMYDVLVKIHPKVHVAVKVKVAAD